MIVLLQKLAIATKDCSGQDDDEKEIGSRKAAKSQKKKKTWRLCDLA
ncbi:MAG: hypothetical protein R3A44_35785 [Caldilineaceae bacterium]